MANKLEADINENHNRLIIRQSSEDTNGELLEMEARYPPNSFQPTSHYHIPANSPHWMYNASNEEGRLLWQVRPALQTQAFLETMWGLEADGKATNILQLAVILPKYAREFRASSPPYPIQRPLFAVLSPIGYLLGYRSRYDKYGKKLS